MLKKRILNEHTCIIFEIKYNSIFSSPSLTLSNYNGRHDLFPQIRLSLFYCSHNQVTNTSCWQSVKSVSSISCNRDDVQIFSTRIVSAVLSVCFSICQRRDKLKCRFLCMQNNNKCTNKYRYMKTVITQQKLYCRTMKCLRQKA